MDALQEVTFPLGRVGLKTDLPRQSRGFTHYTTATNCMFDAGGKIRKFGGAEKINSTAIGSGTAINGCIDFWTGSGIQKFVAIGANGKIYKEDMDGVFDDISGGLTLTNTGNGPQPIFEIANSLLIICTQIGDTILKWTGTGDVAALSGAPTGRGAIWHHNRLWIWNSHTLYYSGYDNPEDWTSADSGKITITTGDGDEILGCARFGESLYVFKGPNRGLIVPIHGKSPASFTKGQTIVGLPLQTHNSIVYLGSDVAFMTPRGCHLLSSVLQLGNVEAGDITYGLKSHFRDRIRGEMYNVMGVNYVEQSCLMWSTVNTALSTQQIFALSYRDLAADGWKAFLVQRDCLSLAIRNNPDTEVDELVTGNSDGFVRRQDITERTVDDAAYSMTLTSPNMILGEADQGGKPNADIPITLHEMYLRCETTAGTADLQVARDDEGAETYTLDCASSGVCQMSYTDPVATGECRHLQFTLTKAGTDEDAKFLELGVRYSPNARSQPTTLP